MSEREELAADIRGLGITVIDGPPVDLSEPLAQHLHSLGYRKPRTITTTEELDTLPVGAVVRCAAGYVIARLEGGSWWEPAHDAPAEDSDPFPATVLHEATA